MPQYLQLHRGSASKMASDSKKDLVLVKGELFVEIPDNVTNNNQHKFKVGDGVTTYENLPYAISSTNTVSQNDTNLITSGGVYNYIDSVIYQAVNSSY